MITSAKNSIYYIICPANFATGGPEALHQLGCELKNQGKTVEMVYLDIEFNIIVEDAVHKSYIKYSVPTAQKIVNSSKHILILPETYCQLIWDKRFSKLKKVVWWLSVTNFHIILENMIELKKVQKKSFLDKLLRKDKFPTLENVRSSGSLHMAHSYFSVDFLKKNGIKVIGQISDYMNESFLEGEDYTDRKEDIAIYNPTKNGEFLEKIMAREKHLQWIPIQNMSPEQVAEMMKRAKLYIDFGYHPGKERMPREGCLMDCCLIIGKKGSASFSEDMPIPDRYRFDFEDHLIPEILQLIQDIKENYAAHHLNMLPYKKVLLKEKQKFSEDVARVFG